MWENCGLFEWLERSWGANIEGFACTSFVYFRLKFKMRSNTHAMGKPENAILYCVQLHAFEFGRGLCFVIFLCFLRDLLASFFEKMQLP